MHYMKKGVTISGISRGLFLGVPREFDDVTTLKVACTSAALHLINQLTVMENHLRHLFYLHGILTL